MLCQKDYLRMPSAKQTSGLGCGSISQNFGTDHKWGNRRYTHSYLMSILIKGNKAEVPFPNGKDVYRGLCMGGDPLSRSRAKLYT